MPIAVSGSDAQPLRPVTVVLADDHVVVRRGMRQLLEESGGIEIVAEASDGAEAMALVREHRPDAVILDIRMPKATGIEVTRWVREQRLPVGVLILTAYDDDPYVVAALQAGANGYVLKTADAAQIAAAVRSVVQGQSSLDPGIARRLIAQVAGAGGAAPVEALSPREAEVLQLAAGGLTNRAIGGRLGISERTVQGHLASVYGRLDVASRTEAVTKALQLGLIHLPERRGGEPGAG
ncbi:MAG: response regulator transcription factor [Anaerolineae bacterium]